MPVETKEMNEGVALVVVSGRLVLGKEVEALENAVNQLLPSNPRLVILDASGLDYADSAGIGTLVACLTSIRKTGGEMRMAGASARIKRLLQITGVDSIVAVYPTVAAATA